jgi:transcriptional regulator with XRE-family HTH domain
MARPLKEAPQIESIDAVLIGKRIAGLRKKRGLTQGQLAELIGISQMLISKYEIGRVKLSAEMLYRFAKALKTSSDTILSLKEEKSEMEIPSLKLIKRMNEMEKLPPADLKMLLRNIDIFIRDSNSTRLKDQTETN